MENVEKEWWRDAFNDADDWEGAVGPNEMPSDKVEAMVKWVVTEATRRGYEEGAKAGMAVLDRMMEITRRDTIEEIELMVKSLQESGEYQQIPSRLTALKSSKV